MSVNINLLVAIRRNKQRRALDGLVQDLRRCTGVELDRSDIVPAEPSANAELRLKEAINESRLDDGSLERISELEWPEAAARLASHFGSYGEVMLIVFPSHRLDFAFRLRADQFVSHARGILEFDEDTVYAVSADVAAGVGLDLYVSEIANDVRFTLDRWPRS